MVLQTNLKEKQGNVTNFSMSVFVQQCAILQQLCNYLRKHHRAFRSMDLDLCKMDSNVTSSVERRDALLILWKGSATSIWTKWSCLTTNKNIKMNLATTNTEKKWKYKHACKLRSIYDYSTESTMLRLMQEKRFSNVGKSISISHRHQRSH